MASNILVKPKLMNLQQTIHDDLQIIIEVPYKTTTTILHRHVGVVTISIGIICILSPYASNIRLSIIIGSIS